jgi:protocatechuate 3,4-dioxygenase beta subunit
VIAAAAEEDEELAEEEEAPPEEPTVDGPGPCIQLEVTARGAPAAGASIFVMRQEIGDEDTFIQEHETVLGATGRARSWCNTGRYEFTLVASGFAPAFQVVETRAGEPEKLIRVALDPGHTLRGRLLDAQTQQPVAGATVELSYEGHFDFDHWEPESAISDAQGYFQVSHLVAGKYDVSVDAPDHVDQGEEVELPRAEPLIIRLDGLARLEGQVVDGATGAPVADARVWLEGPTYEKEENEGRTDAHGRFSIAVEEGFYGLSAQVAGKAGTHDGKVRVRRSQRVEGIVIRLVAASRLSGLVFAAASHEPLPKASVMIKSEESLWVETVETEADGSFLFEDLPPGVYLVRAAAPGYAPCEHGGIRLEPGQEQALECALGRFSSLEGRITDALGRPVSDAVVKARGQGAIQGRQSINLSEEDGHYRVTRLSAGDYQIEVTHPQGSKPVIQDLTIGEGQSAHADFAFSEATGEVEGIVRRSSGGVPRYAVEIRSLLGNTEQSSDEAEEDGRFSFPLMPGSYRLVAAYANSDIEGPEQQVTVEAGKTSHVELAVPDAVTETSGFVLDSKGAPAAGAMVSFSNDELSLSEEADEQGRFLFKSSAGSKDTPVTISAQTDKEKGATQQVRTGSRNVMVRLQRLATVRGSLLVREGPPIERFELEVNWKDRADEDYLTGFEGDTFELDDLQAGLIELRVELDDERGGSVVVRAEPGSTHEVVIPIAKIGPRPPDAEEEEEGESEDEGGDEAEDEGEDDVEAEPTPAPEPRSELEP